MKNINATAVMHNSGHSAFDSSSSPLIGLFVSRVANDVVEAADFDSCSPEAQKKTTRAHQSGPQWLSGRFSHPTGVHDFKVYVPANYRGAPTSLIVMLHGA